MYYLFWLCGAFLFLCPIDLQIVPFIKGFSIGLIITLHGINLVAVSNKDVVKLTVIVPIKLFNCCF